MPGPRLRVAGTRVTVAICLPALKRWPPFVDLKIHSLKVGATPDAVGVVDADLLGGHV